MAECYFPIFILSAFLPHSDLLDTRSWIRLLSRADNQQLTYKNGRGIRRHTSVNATKLDYPTIEIRIDKGTSIKVQKSKLEKQKGAGRSQETLDRLGSNYLPWLFPSSRVSEESNEMMREGHRQGSILKRRWRRPSGSWGLGVAQRTESGGTVRQVIASSVRVRDRPWPTITHLLPEHAGSTCHLQVQHSG